MAKAYRLHGEVPGRIKLCELPQLYDDGDRKALRQRVRERKLMREGPNMQDITWPSLSVGNKHGRISAMVSGVGL